MIPVLVLCMVLIAAFVLVPALTMKIMIFLGNAIRIFSFLLFGVAVFGIFMPKYAVVEDALIEEMLFMVLRMVIAACGGLVLSQVALKRLKSRSSVLGRSWVSMRRQLSDCSFPLYTEPCDAAIVFQDG